MLKKKRIARLKFNIRHERGATTADPMDVNKIIKDYYEPLYSHNFNNFDEMDQFHERHNRPKLTRGERWFLLSCVWACEGQQGVPMASLLCMAIPVSSLESPPGPLPVSLAPGRLPINGSEAKAAETTAQNKPGRRRLLRWSRSSQWLTLSAALATPLGRTSGAHAEVLSWACLDSSLSKYFFINLIVSGFYLFKISQHFRLTHGILSLLSPLLIAFFFFVDLFCHLKKFQMVPVTCANLNLLVLSNLISIFWKKKCILDSSRTLGIWFSKISTIA